MDIQDTRTVISNHEGICTVCGVNSAGRSTICDDCDKQAKVSFPLADEPEFAGKYIIAGCLGSGGMGAVYKAKQLALDKLVAIKLIHQNLMTAAATRRFGIEGKAASRLNHPNVVQVWDLGVTASNQPYLIMEYVEGLTLADQLRKTPQLSLTSFYEIVRQLCLALQHAHEHGIIHRDIKPGNIMLTSSVSEFNQVKVMDFGIAKFMGDENLSAMQLTKTGEMIGSPLYMSPEQARGVKDIDGRSDLYSLGCVMYEVLTGLPPFVGTTFVDTLLKHQNEKVPPLREASMGREINSSVEKIVLKLLEKEPINRYQTAGELLKDLDSGDLRASAVHGDSQKLGKPHKIGQRSFGTNLQRPGKLVLVVVAASFAVGAFLISTFFRPEKKAASPSSNIVSSTRIEQRQPPVVEKKVSNIQVLHDTIHAILLKTRPDEQLHLGDCCIESDVPLSASVLEGLISDVKGFVNVQNLSLAPCEVRNLDLSPLGKMKKLRVLNLDGVQFAQKSLSSIPLIEELNLTSTHVTESGIKALSSMPELRKVNLTSTEITSEQLAELVEKRNKLAEITLVRCPNIAEIDVSTNETRHIGLDIIWQPFFDKEEIRRDIASRDFIGAENCANEVYKRLLSHPNNLQFSDLELLRGDIALGAHQLEVAVTRYKNSLNHLALAKKDPDREKVLYLRLAETLESQKNASAAVEMREKLAKLYDGVPCPSTATPTLKKLAPNNLRRSAMDYCELGIVQKEREYSLKCLNECTRVNFENIPEYTDSAAVIGAYYWAIKNYTDAVKYFRLADEQYRKNPDLVPNPQVVNGLKACSAALKVRARD